MIASVSTIEAVLALLILAVVYLMGAVMWWDLSETCREQVESQRLVAGDDHGARAGSPTGHSPSTPYDWQREGVA